MARPRNNLKHVFAKFLRQHVHIAKVSTFLFITTFGARDCLLAFLTGYIDAETARTGIPYLRARALRKTNIDRTDPKNAENKYKGPSRNQTQAFCVAIKYSPTMPRQVSIMLRKTA